MSTSNWQNISYNIELVKRLDPESILDIGAGFGRWGFLFREFLELWNDDNYSDKWKRVIDGVEIFEPYIKPYHRYFYDNIYICDGLDYLTKTDKKYDLVNCGDVIEHLEKDRGLKLIRTALIKSKYVLINIPLGENWEQGAVHGNDYEAHKSAWKEEDFKIYPYRIVRIFRDMYQRKFAVVLLSSSPIDLGKKYKEMYGRRFGIRNFIKYRLGFKKFAEFFEKG